MRITVRLIVTAVLLGAMVPALLLYSGVWYTKPHADSAPENIIPWNSQIQATSEEHPTTIKQNIHSHIDPELWRNHIQRSCKQFGFFKDQNEIDMNVFKKSKILVDDRNKFLYCQIPKVASTTWRRILIVLSGKVDTNDPMSLTSNDVHHRYNQHLTYLRDLPHDDILYRLNNYFKFVFVREPFERLLSAFRNKFVAKTNSSVYFKKVFGTKIIENYRQRPRESPINGSDLTFQEFIEYLIDPNKKISMNEHWERYYKLCHPCWITYDFIGKLETLEQDSLDILNRISLSGKVKVPSRSDSRYSNTKTNSYMHEYYSKIPKESLHRLFEMYYADFVIFNFTVPDVIQTLMNG